MNPQPAAERRAAEAVVGRLVARFTPAQARLVAAVRRWLRQRLPAAHEVVYEYRDCFVISYSPSERGYEGVFALRGGADGVRFYFNRGKGLPDPEKLLQGSANLVRWIPVEGTSTLTRPAVVALFNAALVTNPVPFAVSGRGPVAIRSAAPKPSSSRPSKRTAERGKKKPDPKGRS